ncbi:uncharacterized protein A4U43_C04F3210 [Asparagus officinalis]|uniref:CBS domain-containing protein n=1 Tax=Asparagus officinalis TaxID=4686 RepID=A0A5P1EZP1_ASPOF|nr:uncharacterized protein A4U43_C04F3210 [Asparagus officinalis]
MSTPAVTLTPDKTVLGKLHRYLMFPQVLGMHDEMGTYLGYHLILIAEAAALMLKKKIHRIPVLNKDQRVVGMVTRTDIFQALETAEE